MKTFFALAVAFLPLALNAEPLPTVDAAAAKTRIEAVVNQAYPELDALYKQIHRHPELPFQEFKTAKLLASKMKQLGYEVTEQVGTTGVVAIYRNGAGPVVMVRTELDALPVEEKTGLPFASREQQIVDGKPTFVAHACGHDVHMAWWFATAKALIAMKDQWRGTLMFVAQPAEENLSGAKAMLADGLFARFPKPDFGFAAHVGGGIPLGTVFIKDGVALSAADAIDIVFNGRGAHGSAPSSAIDPIVMGSQFVTNVQTVISRRKDAGTFGVITVGAFQSGTVGNVIPDRAELKLSVRSFEPDVRELLLNGVERTANSVAAMAGAPAPTITHQYGAAATRNDSGLVARTAELMRPIFGDGLIVAPASAPGMSGSEDFSEFAAAGMRSLYFMIGGDDPAKLADYKTRNIAIPINHSPQFAPAHEAAIRNGATVLALAVLMVTPVQPEPGQNR